MLYDVVIIGDVEKEDYPWIYAIIDLFTFFLLIFLIGNWLVAFIISTIVGILLNSWGPFSMSHFVDKGYLLEFKEDKLVFISEDSENNIFVPFDLVLDVENILTSEKNHQILIKGLNDLQILFKLSEYSSETFNEVFRLIKTNL